jgi:hypothetical protein
MVNTPRVEINSTRRGVPDQLSMGSYESPS